MEDKKYTELLKLQWAALEGITPSCAEDQVLAEYYQGNLAGDEYEAVEAHLVDCRFCRARIGMLERLSHGDTDRRVPETVLAEAKQLIGTKPRNRRAHAPAWAAAALVVIGLFAIFGIRRDDTTLSAMDPHAQISTDESISQMRSWNRSDETRLEVLSPAEVGVFEPGRLIRWSKVPGSIHYNIFVLSLSGDVLWEERVEDNEWTVRDGLHLVAGADYYFRVEAQLPNGRTVSSKHQTLRGAVAE